MPGPAPGETEAPDGVEVCWAALDDAALTRWELLSSDEVARASGYRFALHRDRYVRARVALRLLLAERTGYDAARVPLQTGAAGAPCPLGSVHFSVSHSQALAAFAFARGRRIGIDVEHSHAGCGAVGAAFHPREQATIRSLRGAARDHQVLRYWTVKEAYLKALGVGLHRPLDSFEVVFGDAAPLLRDRSDRAGGAGWEIAELRAPNHAVASLAVEREVLARNSGAYGPVVRIVGPH